MLQYKTLLAESKTPLLLAQKEIASLQKELDSFRKAVDAKAKERDAMEREAKFAKAETEKVCERCPCAVDARRLTAAEGRECRVDGVAPRRRVRGHAVAATARHRGSAALRECLGTAERPEPAQNQKTNYPRPALPETTRPVVPRRHSTVFIDTGREADCSNGNAREGTGKNCLLVGGRDGDLQK
jgi:hypothetical protein